MKEKIYTIPVTDAFKEDCECPMCILEKKLENEYIEYFLGPSLMEPDHRIETNDKGFCRRHFEILYNSQINRLGLGLIVDTHLQEQNKRLKKACNSEKASGNSFIKGLTSLFADRKSDGKDFVDNVIFVLENLEQNCAICSKLDYTMDRYIDVITYLWFKEEEFKKLFNSKKGFCLKHLKQLLKGAKKYLSPANSAVFAKNLLQIQMANMDRIQEEVNWFTQKFDYRNNDKPWGNSKDALLRSVQKIVGYCNLK
ncbi:MAG TPA: ABC transporter substrate-binding protein [Clostridiaceae bacterium]|nr:ABC transporter substrate-binding protein [Clostridiaceae bacterium]